MGLLFALVVLLAFFLIIVNTRAGRALELVAAQERELERLQRLVAAGPAPSWAAPPAPEPEPEPEVEPELAWEPTPEAAPAPVESPWPDPEPVGMASLVGTRPEPTARPRREGPGPIAQALRAGWDQWIAANLLAVAGGVFVLLGAAFFVAVAISHGWLTPPRQVAAAVAGGLALLVAGLRVWDGRDASRPRVVLAQALAGTGAGTMLLGIVAGARIYDRRCTASPSA